jgi:hypothetical protein
VREGYRLDVGADLPDGWRLVADCGWAQGRTSWGFVVPIERVPVPPQPETEPVPWWETYSRTLTNGDKVAEVLMDGCARYRTLADWQTNGDWKLLAIDADGMVSVLVDGDQT